MNFWRGACMDVSLATNQAIFVGVGHDTDPGISCHFTIAGQGALLWFRQIHVPEHITTLSRRPLPQVYHSIRMPSFLTQCLSGTHPVVTLLIVHPWTFSRTVCRSVVVPGHRLDIPYCSVTARSLPITTQKQKQKIDYVREQWWMLGKAGSVWKSGE